MAENVSLHTAYYTDPKFSTISANAERLFVRLLAWCGAHETGGSMPRQVLAMVGLSRSYGALNELITRGLVADNGDLGYSFPSWSKWQSNVDELAKRRKNERERKALSRAKSRDNRDVSQSLGKGREGSSSTDSPVVAEPVSNASASPEPHPGGPAVPVDGWRLVRAAIPDEHPQATRTALALEAGALLNAGTPAATVDAALRLWLTKPNLGPRTLPSLVSEVLKSRAAPAPGSTAATTRGREWIDAGERAAQMLETQIAHGTKELE
ncbi:hypothetical protein ACLQ3K_25800 [Tsukamurella sp. DT100]|uniref:hypothetical protein n=1 Tax=Tsukamurella sp. DT100 TaxID=3393415 RepID=UPI003CFABB5C